MVAAERAFRTAIALNPGLATAHYDLDRLLLCERGIASIGYTPEWPGGGPFPAEAVCYESARCFRAAIAVDPDFTEAYANLGELLLVRVSLFERRGGDRAAVAADT